VAEFMLTNLNEMCMDSAIHFVFLVLAHIAHYRFFNIDVLYKFTLSVCLSVIYLMYCCKLNHSYFSMV